MNYLDDTKDNGWVPVRRNILPHLADGRLTTQEFTVIVYLLLDPLPVPGNTHPPIRCLLIGEKKAIALYRTAASQSNASRQS